MVKSPLRYPGGKSRAVKQIMAQLPAMVIEEYREPFVGGGSVFLTARAMLSRLTRYWINDLNPLVYAFWKTLSRGQECASELADDVDQLKAQFPDGRQLYGHCTKEWSDEYLRAICFFVLNRITFSGLASAGGYSEQAYRKRFTDSSIQRLRDVGPAVDGVKVTNLDYERVVTAEGRGIFIFLDPPYHQQRGSRLYGERGQLHTGFDHERFADVMKSCPHKWLITLDDSPHARELFDWANIIPWELQYGMNNAGGNGSAKGKELFIRNY